MNSRVVKNKTLLIPILFMTFVSAAVAQSSSKSLDIRAAGSGPRDPLGTAFTVNLPVRKLMGRMVPAAGGITPRVQASSSQLCNGGNCRMFISSVDLNGNLGGLLGADATCQARANAAGLIDGSAGGAGGSNKHCADWTSNAPGPFANNGNPGLFTDKRWTYNSATACEDTAARLICVQQ